jgi:aspartyl-tRNA(Asn)/glutamyl-tRNA(Gln) amidotransferase subunit B
MAWEIVVGIETHAQLATASKMFSGASTAFGAAPNTQASAVDIALPGVLPVANRAAIEHAIRFGLAVQGTIRRRSIFARKNYFYPDLPKGYQISQYEQPIVQGGEVHFFLDGREHVGRLTRAHLEEDAGKSLHEDFRGMTGIDLNRAGTPLLEIVSEPELIGAKQAVAYARALHALVVWIGICDGNMQEGSFRCDANVSVRKTGEKSLGTRCEIKNLNSFRFMERAIEFEAKRQIELLEDGGKVIQETRLYDAERDETRAMRTKEDAQDYRYFPDPDLLPLVVSEQTIRDIESSLPELPDAKRRRFEEMRVPAETAALLTATRDRAEYFERAIGGSEAAAAIANLVVGDVAAHLTDAGLSFAQSPLAPQDLATLQRRIGDGTISGKIAKELLKAKFEGEKSPIDELIDRRGLRQISDAGAIEQLVDGVLTANGRLVADYRSGKEKAFNALVGQVMKASKGKANPVQAAEALRRKLG